MIVNKQLVILPRDRLRSFTAVKLHVYFFILSNIQYLLLLYSVYYVKRASLLILTAFAVCQALFCILCTHYPSKS